MGNPVIPFAELATQRWFAQVNDLIGGAIVANVDKPASAIFPEPGERVLCDMIEPEVARYVVALHSAHLDALANLARSAEEIDPDDYDEDSPEGKHDLAYDEGHRCGMAHAAEPLLALIYEACLTAVEILEKTPQVDHAAHLTTLLGLLGQQVEPYRGRQLPDDLEQEIYDASEGIGWWDMARFITMRPAVAFEFLREYAPERLVTEPDNPTTEETT